MTKKTNYQVQITNCGGLALQAFIWVRTEKPLVAA